MTVLIPEMRLAGAFSFSNFFNFSTGGDQFHTNILKKEVFKFRGGNYE